MCHFYFGLPFFGGFFGWIWMVLGLILTIGLIIILIRRSHFDSISNNFEKNNNINEDPLTILKRMYVKGEISEDEYEKRKKVIGN